MQLLKTRTGRTREARAWTTRNARRLLAVGVCGTAAVSFAAGVAPGIGWGLLMGGMAMAAEALISRE